MAELRNRSEAAHAGSAGGASVPVKVKTLTGSADRNIWHGTSSVDSTQEYTPCDYSAHIEHISDSNVKGAGKSAYVTKRR